MALGEPYLRGVTNIKANVGRLLGKHLVINTRGYVTADPTIGWAHSSALCFLLALRTFLGWILHIICQTMGIFSMDLTFNQFINNFILENKATKKCPLKPTLLKQYNGWFSR
jgi:hypothetical protein